MDDEKLGCHSNSQPIDFLQHIPKASGVDPSQKRQNEA